MRILRLQGKNCKISALQQNCYAVWNIFFAVMAPKKNVHANKDMKGDALLDIFDAPSWHVPIKRRIDWQACRRCQEQLCKRSFIESLKGRRLRNKTSRISDYKLIIFYRCGSCQKRKTIKGTPDIGVSGLANIEWNGKQMRNSTSLRYKFPMAMIHMVLFKMEK